MTLVKEVFPKMANNLILGKTSFIKIFFLLYGLRLCMSLVVIAVYLAVFGIHRPAMTFDAVMLMLSFEL